MTLLDDEQLTAHVDSDAKALIEEARRRHRKRWFVIRIFVLIAVVVGGVSY